MLLIKSKKIRITIYICLITAIIVWTFIIGIQTNMHKILPHPDVRHTNAIGIAISGLQYGSEGYVGYKKVLNTLWNNGMNLTELQAYSISNLGSKENLDTLNLAISKALNIDNVSSEGDVEGKFKPGAAPSHSAYRRSW